MAERKPKSATTLVLGIVSLIVSIILLGILGYSASQLHGVPTVAIPVVAHVFMDIFVLLSASVFTISAAVQDAKVRKLEKLSQ